MVTDDELEGMFGYPNPPTTTDELDSKLDRIELDLTERLDKIYHGLQVVIFALFVVGWIAYYY